MKIRSLYPLVLWLLFLLGCGSLQVGGADTDGTGGVIESSGIIYAPSGDVGAPKARVILIRTVGTTDSTVATTTTDSLGHYQLGEIPAGHYSLVATKDGLVAFRSDLTITSDPQTEPFLDTLREPGSFVGTVVLAGGHDPRKVIIAVLGTGHIWTANENGSFNLDAVPAGTFTIRFIMTTNDNYGVLDTVVTIVSGDQSVAVGPLHLPYSLPLSPDSVALTYNEFLQVVSLQWDAQSDSVRWNVYRDQDGQTAALAPLNKLPIDDTFFVDSLPQEGERYRYRVVALSSGGREGVGTTSAPVGITTPWRVVKTIELGTTQEPLDSPAGLAFGNGLLFVADKTGGRVLVLDTAGNHVRVIEGEGDNLLVQPIAIVWHNNVITVMDQKDYRHLVQFSEDGTCIRQMNVSAYGADVFHCTDNGFVLLDKNAAKLVAIDMQGTLLYERPLQFAAVPSHLSSAVNGKTYGLTWSQRSIQTFPPNLSAISSQTIPLDSEYSPSRATAFAAYNGTVWIGVLDSSAAQIPGLDDQLRASHRFRIASTTTEPVTARDIAAISDSTVMVLTADARIIIYRLN